MNDGSGLDQGDCSGVDTSGQSLCILKVEARWLATGLDIGCGKKRERGVKHDFKVLA